MGKKMGFLRFTSLREQLLLNRNGYWGKRCTKIESIILSFSMF
jgi:hypothetical protein